MEESSLLPYGVHWGPPEYAIPKFPYLVAHLQKWCFSNYCCCPISSTPAFASLLILIAPEENQMSIKNLLKDYRNLEWKCSVVTNG